MSRPPRVKNLLAAFEKTICTNNESGVTSGMYLTTQLAGRSTGVKHPALRKKQGPGRQTSAGGKSTGTASLTVSDHDSRDDCTAVSPTKTSDQRTSNATSREYTSQRNVEVDDHVGFTVAYCISDDTDDDNASCVSAVTYSSSSRRSSIVIAPVSVCGSQEYDDKSVSSAFSRTSARIRELPRDVEFDSDDSSDSELEDESKTSQQPSIARKRAPKHW